MVVVAKGRDPHVYVLAFYNKVKELLGDSSPEFNRFTTTMREYQLNTLSPRCAATDILKLFPRDEEMARWLHEIIRIRVPSQRRQCR